MQVRREWRAFFSSVNHEQWSLRQHTGSRYCPYPVHSELATIPPSGKRLRDCLRYYWVVDRIYRSCVVLSVIISLRRILIVLSLALLAMQGAFAHEHAVQARSPGHSIIVTGAAGQLYTSSHTSSRCATMLAPGSCRHGHSSCCVAACGAHCGAILATFRFEPRISDTSPPRPLTELRDDGVTHAPPLRPPIG